MKILVYGSREFKAGFMKAQSQCGHQVLFTDRLPSAEDAISFSPDAVILMVQRPASRIQDCLAVLYESCSARRFLLFEPHPNGNCFFAETTQQDDSLHDFFREAAGWKHTIPLQYPAQSWQLRFPDAFENLQRREAMKTMLYGVTREEFEKYKRQYRLHINTSDFYLFMWELDKTVLVDYPVNKSIHYFLHALRLEDFSMILEENQGGEIVFSDISFAYILVNASHPSCIRTRRQQADHFALEFSKAAGQISSHCFISDLLLGPEDISRGHQDFKRTCAYRFFCREAVAISNDYIKSHQRWFSRDEIQNTIDAIEHYLSFDISSKELPELIRRLYLKIVKPSMSYKLYYLVSESILKSLKSELSVKLLMETIDSPWLVLTTQLGTIEESCTRVLDCIHTLAKQQVKTHNISNRVVRQVLRYMEEHYAEPLSVSDIARDFNVSPSYLIQCFKKETGASMKHYLTMLRMQQAKKLLLTTDDSVSSIAIAVGYDDYRQFSKMFKVYTGVTPVQCRKGVM